MWIVFAGCWISDTSYIYICTSDATDRALVYGMSIYVNIFYLYGTPLPFMLQEATQPTAEQKKAGDPEQGLKGCWDRRPEWKFGLSQEYRKHYTHIYIYIYLFNLLCVISSIHKPAEQFTFML